MLRKTVLFLVLFLCIFIIESVQVKKIEISSYVDFQKGTLKGINLNSKGSLFIGPKIERISGPNSEYYLSLDISKNGDLYVGTGHKASVYRIKSGIKQANSIEEIFKSNYLDIYALLVRDNGEVIVGTSPNGKVLKILKNKKVIELFNPDEKFIWDLKEDNLGDIICAVGNTGGIYKINKSGDASKIFAAEDSHIISLYITKYNSILAGSGDRGILYKIDNRKVKVLFDSPYDEIRGICEDKEGNIYFSATMGISNLNTQKKTLLDPFFRSKPRRLEILPSEKSSLYRIRTNGIVERIWSLKDEYIYTIFYDKNNNDIIVGTGNSGRLYRVKMDESFSIVYESDSAQIFKISGKGKGFSIITNNTATIAKIGDNLNSKGTYLSKIYDLGIKSKLGKIYWDARSVKNSEVLFFIRTGNSNTTDKTWTEWSAPFTDREDSTINVSGYRYVQMKSILNSSNIARTPYLNSCTVFYIQSNIKPKIKKIKISEPIQKKSKIKNKKVKSNKYLIVKWEAKDPNKDRLKYKIYLKKYKGKNWILFKENIRKEEIEVRTEFFEDGRYLIKVIVDDSLDNPPSISKSNTIISPPFIIDSTAPIIRNFSIVDNIVRFDAGDRTSKISSVLYSFDGNIWYPIFPDDLINDSKSEKFNLNLKKLNPKKIILIKVMDEFKNYKVFQKEL